MEEESIKIPTMSEDVVKIPTIKILFGITLLNFALVTGGTLFSTVTVKSIQSNYERSLASVRQSEREYQEAINLLENVSRETDVINARINASIIALSADVKEARDKQILRIEGEADYVVDAGVEARSNIRKLEQVVSRLASVSQDNISSDFNSFQSQLLSERKHLEDMSMEISEESKAVRGHMLASKAQVTEFSDRSKIELQMLGQHTIELSKKLRMDMLQTASMLSEKGSKSSAAIEEGLAQFRVMLKLSEGELSAVTGELEDIRMAIQVGQEMINQAPASGGKPTHKTEAKKGPETD